MGGTVTVIRSLGDLADLVAALPSAGALPLRTVLVASERQAHALRRALVRTKRERTLAGTRFVGPLTLALELCRDAGLDLVPGEEELRAARLLALFAGPLELEHFDLALLREAPGWPAAFARSISELEGAGLVPDALPASTPRWRDLALVWRRLEAAAGPSATAARVYRAAGDLLRKGARPATGPVLAAVTGRETAPLAGFLLRLPGLALALWHARPLRERHLARVEALYGPEAREALAAAPLPEATAKSPERDLLARFLFAPPALLADPLRPRSAGPDGTVELSEHAGVEGELEAAADWVARELLERRTPLEQVAVLAPSKGPLLSLLAARLARLPWRGGTLPIHVAGGLPLTERAGGARTLALVRALAAFLPAEAVAALLPSLRAGLGERKHLSIQEAMEVAWSLGTAGGNAGEPGLALSWSPRAAAREAALAAEVEAATEARDRGDAGTLACLRAVRPALDALVDLAKLVVDRAPLSTLAPALVAFARDWLLDPGPGAPVHALLADALEAPAADATTGRLGGGAALALVEERLLSLRLSTARFGEPALFIGPVAAAAGLDFAAVRVVGLAEGALPSAVREDPVLPEPMRLEAHPLLVPIAADRVAAQLHALDGALHAASRAVAFSFPRSDLDRSEREPSSLLVEIGAALGRPDPRGKGAIPDLRALERVAFGPARAAARAFRTDRPVGEVAWQDRAARLEAIPAAWTVEPAVAIAPILERLSATELGPDTGLLGTAGPLPEIPGLSPRRPISASALGTLLGCPLAFCLERVLHWREPAAAPSLRQLEATEYGSLFHGAAEAFYRTHGEDFVARRRTLAHWQREAQAVADARLAALLETRPLVGRGVVEKERGRLRRDLARFLDQDWRLPLDRFVDVERAFGEPKPLALDAGGIALHVRGYIDRVDVARGRTLLRDLKTGTPHPRRGEEEGLDPGLDLQLGLYGLVARQLADAWGVPARVDVAYAYVGHREERAWRGADSGRLEAATRGWLGLAARLLSDHSFPPSPDADTCTWCPFRPVCGAGTPARAAAARLPGAAGEWLAAARGDAEEEDE